MSAKSGHEVTRLLRAHQDGSNGAMSQLMELVYPDLKRMARRQRGHAGQTLDATSLVNELYLKLVVASDRTISNRAHFFALSARVMRQVVIDYARSKASRKRGGDAVRVPLEDHDAAVEREAEQLLALDAALTALGRSRPEVLSVVECRYFAGYSLDETAEAASISRSSVIRYWREAKKILRRELEGAPD